MASARLGALSGRPRRECDTSTATIAEGGSDSAVGVDVDPEAAALAVVADLRRDDMEDGFRAWADLAAPDAFPAREGCCFDGSSGGAPLGLRGIRQDGGELERGEEKVMA